MLLKALSKFKEEISLSSPLKTNSIKYDKHRWLKHFTKKKQLGFLDEYHEKDISRLLVINEFKKFFDGKSKSALHPFLMTMIWGYDSPGYGPMRVNKLVEENNITLIDLGMKDLKNCDFEKAYKDFKKIHGLSISFISKILYFAGKAQKLKDYPLIFDIRVAKALVSLSSKGQQA